MRVDETPNERANGRLERKKEVEAVAYLIGTIDYPVISRRETLPTIRGDTDLHHYLLFYAERMSEHPLPAINASYKLGDGSKEDCPETVWKESRLIR
jgi:hypothetical protein